MERNCKECLIRNIRYFANMIANSLCLIEPLTQFGDDHFVTFWKSPQPQQPQDDQQWLLTCISQYLGFSGSKPVATLLIYQCLLRWRSFEAMKTGVFDSILHAINSAIEVPRNFFGFIFHFPSFLCSTDDMAYNFCLLQQNYRECHLPNVPLQQN